MSTVTPKLLYCKYKHRDIPVWEIITDNGIIYYERPHRKGYRPIGLRCSFMLGESGVNVCDVVIRNGKNPFTVFKEKDGYVSPNSWYEPIGKRAAGSDEDVEDYIENNDN